MANGPDLLSYGVYGSVFLAVLLLVLGFGQLQSARRDRARSIRRRLRQRDRTGPRLPGAGSLRRVTTERENALGERVPGARRLTRLLNRAGLAMPFGALVAVMAGLSLVFALTMAAVLVLSSFLGWDSWAVPALSVLLGLACGFGVPFAYLRHRAARRLALFNAQLPEALEVMVRSLRAGHPVAAAMSLVHSDLPEPIAGEFGKVVDEMTYGLDLRQALGHLAARVEAEDLRFVVASVSLQFETGGNLAEVLQRLADLIRARAGLSRKVLTFTAEARLSARILAVMPLIFTGLVFWANPGIYSEAARDPLFLPILLGAGSLQAFGILVMNRMSRIQV